MSLGVDQEGAARLIGGTGELAEYDRAITVFAATHRFLGEQVMPSRSDVTSMTSARGGVERPITSVATPIKPTNALEWPAASRGAPDRQRRVDDRQDR